VHFSLRFPERKKGGARKGREDIRALVGGKKRGKKGSLLFSEKARRGKLDKKGEKGNFHLDSKLKEKGVGSVILGLLREIWGGKKSRGNGYKYHLIGEGRRDESC